MMRRLGLTIAFALTMIGFAALSGCEENIAFYNPQLESAPTKVDSDFPVKTLLQASRLNIIWVIDNSGSMSDYQRAVIRNASNFIVKFSSKKLDWKMGLLSTDVDDPSYIGFEPTQPLNSSMPLADAITEFIISVSSLGTNGSGSEETLEPLVNNLKKYPDFIDPGASVALIFITDAEEQSPSGRDWLSEFRALSVKATNVFGYGVFAANDFNCESGEGAWDYADSQYRPFLEGLSGHKTLRLCEPDFGTILANIGDDLLQRIANFSIPLRFRPKQRTISVSYLGVPLKPGPQENGGQWYYDYFKNAIVLYDLSFAKGENESVHVYAEEDDGRP